MQLHNNTFRYQINKHTVSDGLLTQAVFWHWKAYLPQGMVVIFKMSLFSFRKSWYLLHIFPAVPQPFNHSTQRSPHQHACHSKKGADISAPLFWAKLKCQTNPQSGFLENEFHESCGFNRFCSLGCFGPICSIHREQFPPRCNSGRIEMTLTKGNCCCFKKDLAAACCIPPHREAADRLDVVVMGAHWASLVFMSVKACVCVCVSNANAEL